ncbi:MAG: efflux RND transporter periplasmic adaptor subunit, partial [Bacteroidota bacterium]|nr:efflux RND transporter periplasmic adaptor subunit [Bacteroidota bacterium]
VMMIALFSCGDKNKNDAKTSQPPPAVSVSVTQVKDTAVVYFDEYPATVTPLDQVEIRAQVLGYINGIYFKDGQRVTKGQKLYTIDQQQYRGQYEQAVANLNVAKATEAKAQQDADRYQQLAQQDAIARQVLEHSIADLNSAKSGVAAQVANIQAVQTNLRYSTIYAPVSGTIGISQVKYGAAVSPGSTVLNTVSSDDPMAVDFPIDQKNLPRFVELQKKGTKPSDSVFTVSLPGGYLYPQNGKIYLIDRAVDPQTGTIKVRLTFPNKDQILRAGMTCNVRVKNNDADQKQILIPYKSVVEQMGEFSVYIVGDSSKAIQKKVVLGRRINENVIVKSGLEANETIITEGVQKLKEGVKVKTDGMDSTQMRQGQKAANSDSAKK